MNQFHIEMQKSGGRIERKPLLSESQWTTEVELWRADQGEYLYAWTEFEAVTSAAESQKRSQNRDIVLRLIFNLASL